MARNGLKVQKDQPSSHLLVIGFTQIRSRIIFILIPVPTNLIRGASVLLAFI